MVFPGAVVQFGFRKLTTTDRLLLTVMSESHLEQAEIASGKKRR